MTHDFSKTTIRTKSSAIAFLKLGWRRHGIVLFSKIKGGHLASVRQHYHAARGTGGGKFCHLSPVQWYIKKPQGWCYTENIKEIDDELYREVMDDLNRITEKCQVESRVIGEKDAD